MLARGFRIELDLELLAADECTIRHAARRGGFHADRSVLRDQFLWRCAQTRGGQTHQRFARRGRGQCQIRAVEVRRMRLLSRRRSLIRRHRRVALDQTHAFKRHAQLFGDQLHLRGVQPLAEFTFAGIGRDRAVGGDRDPRVELRAPGPVEALRQDAAQAIRNAGRGEGHDHRARSLEERPTREAGPGQRASGIRGQPGCHTAASFA